MKVHTIDVDKLKREGDLCSLWFQYDNGDLYILLSPTHVDYFEFTLDEQHLEGGLNRTLKYGNIIESQPDEPGRIYKRSRLIEYRDSIPDDFLKWCQRFMHECPGVEPKLKEGIIEYLVHRGEKTDSLKLEEGYYESYRGPLEPPPPVKDYKKLKKISSIAALFLLMISIGVGINTLKNKVKDKTLKTNCEKGDQEACKDLQSAQILTLNKDAVTAKISTKNNRDIDKKIVDCINNSNCDLNQFVDVKQDKIHFWLYKSCLKNQYKPACAEALSFVYKDIDKIDSRLQDSIKSTEQYCQGNNHYICQEVKLMKSYLQNRVECANDVHSGHCQEYVQFLIEKGFKTELYPDLKKFCNVSNGPLCFKYGEILSNDASLLEEDRIEKSRSIWKKACFEISNFDSCYFYSWKPGERPKFKEQKERKLLLKDCKKGDESSCQSLKSLARKAD